jgi:ABC-type nitrate/sulfonate/bicarbonate transport system substrate-binding protein
MEVSGLIYNTDWAAKNQETLDKFTLAYIRGARCYLEAAHDGPNREEMINYFLKHSPVKDRSIYNTRWQDVNPDGRVMVDSLLDQQDFHARNGHVKTKSTPAELVDEGPVMLGPYTGK